MKPTGTNMTQLDEKMLDHIGHIVFVEKRPFSYRDFSVSESCPCPMAYGTFRNKIYKLKRNNEVEVAYRSSQTYYTVRGQNFRKPMTTNHAVVHNNPLFKLLQDLPVEKRSIHDIRLKFNVPGIWKKFSVNPNFHKNSRSQDVVIPSIIKDNVIVKTIVHKTNTVSVILGCSMYPIPIDVKGVIRLFNLLVRVEERLQTALDNGISVVHDRKLEFIPEYKSWIVTMWHFGRDASINYVGDRFCTTVKDSEDILIRIYVKDFDGKKRIRLERQELPNETLIDAIKEKLS